MSNELKLLTIMCPNVDFGQFTTEQLASVPKHKHDTDAVKNARNLSEQDIAPLYSVLLTWLQDYNWPVAQGVVDILKAQGTKLESDVREVLKTNDEVWKYWLLTCLLDVQDLALASKLKADLQQLSKGDNTENVADIASAILAKLP